MVHRHDLRKLNRQTTELQAALDDLRELHDVNQRSGVTVDSTEYADAQQRVKDAVATLVTQSDDIVDRTDVYEADDGTVLVDLPDAALARDGSAKTLPTE